MNVQSLKLNIYICLYTSYNCCIGLFGYYENWPTISRLDIHVWEFENGAMIRSECEITTWKTSDNEDENETPGCRASQTTADRGWWLGSSGLPIPSSRVGPRERWNESSNCPKSTLSCAVFIEQWKKQRKIFWSFAGFPPWLFFSKFLSCINMMVLG